jgi:hypothetical protein
MPDFKLPLSGNVTQAINPWTNFFNPVVYINLGNSSNPEVEEQVLSDVASYGKQLGRISDALAVLLAHFHPQKPLSLQEQKALHDFTRMLEDIADVKERHANPDDDSRSA